MDTPIFLDGLPIGSDHFPFPCLITLVYRIFVRYTILHIFSYIDVTVKVFVRQCMLNGEVLARNCQMTVVHSTD